jgi:DNA-binding CsgD family transcriptional regulator
MSRPRLIRDEAAVAVLNAMRRMCVDEGLSTAAIAKRLNADGVPSPRGRRWSETGVNNALTCPAHAGLVKNREGEWVPGLHWDQRLWEPQDRLIIISAIRSRVRRFEAVAEGQPEAFLLGLARCGTCGAPLRWATDQASQYRCVGDRTQPRAEAHVYVNGDRLTKAVLRHVEALSQSQEILARAEESVRAAIQESLEPVRAEIDAANRQADALWSAKERLLDAIQDGTVTQGNVRGRIERLERDRAEALERARVGQARIDASGDRERLCKGALSKLRQFTSLWECMTVYERRELLSTCVESLTVSCEEGRILVRLKLVAMDEAEIPVLRGRKRWKGGILEGPEGLSQRRLAVLYHLSLGRPNLETAAVMEISLSQVTKTLRDVRKHLRVATNEEVLELCRETIALNLSELPLYGEANRRRSKDSLRLMEWQALELAAQGQSTEQIAERYRVPLVVVATKLASALSKAGDPDPARALARAEESGLLPTEKWETGTRKTERREKG